MIGSGNFFFISFDSLPTFFYPCIGFTQYTTCHFNIDIFDNIFQLSCSLLLATNFTYFPFASLCYNLVVEVVVAY